MYALVDSNSFFVSCERLFRPDLEDKPVIVLSSNDGCAVSRSNEAKALGVKMGEPVFKLRDRFTVLEPKSRDRPSPSRPSLVAFSANFELYGDISERIATQLTSITPRIEIYSVDEAFLDLDELDIADYIQWGKAVRASILKNIGIPVSIGIAPTKTLCKLANHWAKTHENTGGVFYLELSSTLNSYLLTLGSVGVADVWGVGWRLAPKLRAEGVFTALDLARMRPQRAQQLMGIHGRHMVYELGGTRCLPLQPATKPQRMISRGRQFGADTHEESVVEAAVTALAARAARILRRDGQLATRASVFLQTNYHKPGYARVFHSVRFYTPTADTGTICSQLIRTLHREFRGGLRYHKADVTLYDLVPACSLQTDVFGLVNLAAHARSQSRMQAVDAITAKYGARSLRPAAELLSDAWHPRHNLLSPRYTSNWGELPMIHLSSIFVRDDKGAKVLL